MTTTGNFPSLRLLPLLLRHSWFIWVSWKKKSRWLCLVYTVTERHVVYRNRVKSPSTLHPIMKSRLEKWGHIEERESEWRQRTCSLPYTVYEWNTHTFFPGCEWMCLRPKNGKRPVQGMKDRTNSDILEPKIHRRGSAEQWRDHWTSRAFQGLWTLGFFGAHLSSWILWGQTRLQKILQKRQRESWSCWWWLLPDKLRQWTKGEPDSLFTPTSLSGISLSHSASDALPVNFCEKMMEHNGGYTVYSFPFAKVKLLLIFLQKRPEAWH